jgi:Na+/melibiose symporter-like transporter
VGVVALVLLFFYQLNEATMSRIKAELEARRKASGEGVASA